MGLFPPAGISTRAATGSTSGDRGVADRVRPLVTDFGASPAFRLQLFTIDTDAYVAEILPLAAEHPALAAVPANALRRRSRRAPGEPGRGDHGSGCCSDSRCGGRHERSVRAVGPASSRPAVGRRGVGRAGRRGAADRGTRPHRTGGSRRPDGLGAEAISPDGLGAEAISPDGLGAVAIAGWPGATAAFKSLCHQRNPQAALDLDGGSPQA